MLDGHPAKAKKGQTDVNRSFQQGELNASVVSCDDTVSHVTLSSNGEDVEGDSVTGSMIVESDAARSESENEPRGANMEDAHEGMETNLGYDEDEVSRKRLEALNEVVAHLPVLKVRCRR